VREFLADWLTEKAETDDYYLITGDLGFGVFDEYRKANPERFFNAGVAEQSMMSMASALSEFSQRTFVYSIGNFASLRCLEQIRNDVAYMKKKVTIISVGSGFSYGAQGYTHHAIEDIAASRVLANLEIYSPCDYFELALVLERIKESNNPSLLRLGRGGEEKIHHSFLPVNQEFPIEVVSGSHGAVLFHGPIGVEVMKAIRKLGSNGFSLSAISCPSLSFASSFYAAISKFSDMPIIIVEENSKRGGLASAILESLIGKNINISKFISLGTDDELIHVLGSQEYLRKIHGIDSVAIEEAFYALRGISEV
jgi:transketolase